MIYKVSTPSSTLPLNVTEMKEHLRIETYSDHDNMVQSYIEAAAQSFENKSNVCLTSQTWKAFLSKDEVVEYIYLEKYPITSITSIQYYDSDDSQQTMAVSNYTASLNTRPVEIYFDTVPTVYDRIDAMEITFVAGYSTVPKDIILALKQKVYKVYNDPNDFVENKMTYFDKVARDYRSYER